MLGDNENIPFPAKFLPTSSSICQWYLFETFFTFMVAKWWFSDSINPISFISYNSTLRKNFFFFPIYLFIHFYISIDSMSYLLYHYLFWCSNCLRFGQWELFQLTPVFFWHNPIIFSDISILSEAKRCSRLIFYCPCLSLRISQFSKKDWLPLLDNSV